MRILAPASRQPSDQNMILFNFCQSTCTSTTEPRAQVPVSACITVELEEIKRLGNSLETFKVLHQKYTLSIVLFLNSTFQFLGAHYKTYFYTLIIVCIW